MGSAAATGMAMAIPMSVAMAIPMSVAMPIALPIAISVAIAIAACQCLSRWQHYGHQNSTHERGGGHEVTAGCGEIARGTGRYLNTLRFTHDAAPLQHF